MLETVMILQKVNVFILPFCFGCSNVWFTHIIAYPSDFILPVWINTSNDLETKMHLFYPLTPLIQEKKHSLMGPELTTSVVPSSSKRRSLDNCQEFI